jgi:hypothetical protein
MTRTVRAGIIGVLAISSFAVTGCKYLAARGRDATDIISLGISSGSGIGVRAGVTRLLALEVIAQKDERFFGFYQRNFNWTESGYGLLFACFRMPTVGDEPPPPRWKGWDYLTTSRRRILRPNRPEIEDRRHTLFILSGGHALRAIDFLDVEVGISALIGGLEMSIRPGQLADFLLGWFGIDLGGDDGTPFGESVVPPPPPKPRIPGSDMSRDPHG